MYVTQVLMAPKHASSSRAGRLGIATLLIIAGLLATMRPMAARAAEPVGGSSSDPPVPVVPGYPPVASPVEATPQALPKKQGKVPLHASKTILKTKPAPPTSPSTTPTPTTSAPTKLAPTTGTRALDGTAAPSAAAAAGPSAVTLRALVVAVDASDFGVATWQSTLDRVGAAYDIFYTRSMSLATDTLLRPDGTGRYNAILLTNSMQLYQDSTGAWVSGLSTDQWNLLWAYERDYSVRQATLYSSYGTYPEDYCTRGVSEGTVGATPLATTLTTSGSQVLNYLNAAARVPVVESYVYRNRLEPGCNGQAVLSAGSDILGVLTTSVDGRERLALSFTSNQYLLQASLLTFGLFRWASRGLYLGEQRHYLNVDVDDWFNSTDEQLANGTLAVDGYQMSGHDAYNAYLQQGALRSRYPLAAGFRMDLAYNGADANLAAGSQCWPSGGISRLTATSRCLRNEFRWINHTLTHPKMNFTDYATNVTEIAQNITVAQQLGLPVDRSVLKTGEYSGLGVYNPDVTNDIDPPTDYGLAASNPDLLRAAKDQGVKYLHGNMSFVSHQPPCFNCGLWHPVETSLTIVPDWPTNIAYFSTTPAEETYFYNSFYGPNGKFPYFPANLTYSQIIEFETDQALNRVATGSVYTNTFHIGNLRDYGNGRTLTTDWADRLMAKYGSYYSTPLLNPGWPALATYTSTRNAHFATLGAGVDVLYDRVANTITVASPIAGSVTLSGANVPGATTYGSDLSGQVTLSANVAVTFTPRPLP